MSSELSLLSCTLCKIRLDKTGKANIKCLGRQLYCKACYEKARKPRGRTRSDSTGSKTVRVTPETSEPVAVRLELATVSGRHDSCMFKCTGKAKLVTLSPEGRVSILRELRIAIPIGARCCESHVDPVKRILKPEAKLLFQSSGVQIANTLATPDDIISLIDSLREAPLSQPALQHLTISKLDSYQLKQFTGLSTDEFNTLLTHTDITDKTNVIGHYLTYLYSNPSEHLMSAIFGIHQSTISRQINKAREALMVRFVPENLGLESASREKVRENHTSIAERLSGVGPDNIISIWDGTYLYIPKSDNIRLQQLTYGGSKKRNLEKPMVVITPNGYIIDILNHDRLWAANVSDADILKSTMQTPEFKEFFREGDVFVLDRGFMTAKNKLVQKGFKVMMPEFLDKKQKQFTARQANTSAFCTKIRWPVEAVNKQMKTYKYMSRVISIHRVSVLPHDIRVVAALVNKFSGRLVSDDDDVTVADRMIALDSDTNKLQKLVEANHLTTRGSLWIKMDGAAIPEFPSIHPITLKRMVSGYKLKLAPAYYAQHTSGSTKQYEISVCKEEKIGQAEFLAACLDVLKPLLVKVKMPSRHSKAKAYAAFILIDLHDSKLNEDKLVGQYCQCRNGARTVGVCAHVACVIWYLGYKRHEDLIRGPSDGIELPQEPELENSDTDDDNTDIEHDNNVD